MQLYYKIIESWCGGLNWKFPFPRLRYLDTWFPFGINVWGDYWQVQRWRRKQVTGQVGEFLMPLPPTALFQMWAPRLPFLPLLQPSLMPPCHVTRALSPLQLHVQIAALPTSCFWSRCLLQQKSDQCIGQSAFLRVGKKEYSPCLVILSRGQSIFINDGVYLSVHNFSGWPQPNSKMQRANSHADVGRGMWMNWAWSVTLFLHRPKD